MATRIAVLLLTGASIALASSRAAAQTPATGDTLSLMEVYTLVDARNPMLAAARSRTDAVRSMESSAKLPPDPQLRVGVMNASLPGLKTDMPTSMAPSIEVMQMVPLPGKLGLSGEIARKETAIAAAEAAETGWMARARAAMPFYEIYSADRQLETMRRTLRLLEDFEKVSRAMYSSGEGRQADVLRAGVEVARMRADIERMSAMRAGAVARLNGILDRPVDTAIPAVAEPSVPDSLPAAETLREWAAATRPLLQRSSFAVEQAAARRSLARRELWPDLSVGVQYGQRDAGEMGIERMGSLMVGVSVPIFARQRQLRMREEAAAMQEMAEAEQADARAQVHARISELLAELDRARTLTALYRGEVLPQAEAAVQSAFSSYRVGSVDFMTLVDAQMTLNEYEQELHRLRADYGRMVAELEMTIGRDLPASSTEEDR
jgi:cobalt-zinc-cadmium efflux system outer membrane protein